MDEMSVAIIGGGPAGLQAAITLAENGVKTTLFEEHPMIGKPIQCGEGLSFHAFNDFNLPKNEKSFCVKELDVCHLNFPENNTIYGDIKATMIKRDKFDLYLSEKASDLGAEIITSTKITNIQRTVNKLILKTKNKNEYHTDYLILAEGPNALLAQKLAFEPPSPTIKAFEYKIKGEWTDKLEFHFNAELYPFGYCWIFPRDSETNIGIVTTAKNRRQLLDNFLCKNNIKKEIVKKVGGKIPMHGAVKCLHSDKILLAGDTAGMVNPIFYGGIRLAMTSGRSAGETIAEIIKGEIKSQNAHLDIYVDKLSKHEFMKKINLECHKFFYTRSNKFLTHLGEIFKNKYINRIEGLEIVKTAGKLIGRPKMLTKPLGLYRLYKGFMIARDWGF